MTHDDYSKLAEEQSATLQATARMLHIRNKGDDRYLASQLEQAADTLSSLAAQAQEWKKDAERYWWLYNGDVDGLIIMRGTVEHSEDIAALVDGEELDTIIDERIAIATALAAEEKKT